MNVRQEFIERVNDAVKTQCEMYAGDHTGQVIAVIVPVPKAFSIDCEDVSGIELNEVEIAAIEKCIDPQSGEVTIDGPKMGLTLYQVTGKVKK